MQAWLGEAIEIKPATTATFERYVRSNLLIVGSEEHGHGLLLATLLSAAVQCSPAHVRFTIAEFTRPSSPFHGFFAPLENLPHQVRIADRRTAGAALDDLIADMDARLAASDGGGSAQPERFFLIAGMHRWHELLAEGDYGRPSEISASLIRLADKGPDAGIHVVAWADSYATAERALRRAGIGFFGLRAVLRVLSPAESDSLLGVSAAASLDDDRALFRDTEWPAEQVEKFKPYSTASLYAFVREAFASGIAGDQHDRAGAGHLRAVAASPYLSLRQAVRPAILAHWLLAGDRERAGKLAAECEDLLFLTRELLKAAGRVHILAGPAPPRCRLRRRAASRATGRPSSWTPTPRPGCSGRRWWGVRWPWPKP